jgi:phosphoglycerate kinase
MKLLSIKECELFQKKVFIRCDFNVPMDEFGNITDDRRIRSALATIAYCLDQECAIILASHFGRPKAGVFSHEDSLHHVARRLHQLLKMDVKLAPDVIGEETKTLAANLKHGEILLLENLRFEMGETKNDAALSAQLASLAEVYINDAFGVSHRAHASVAGITDYFDAEHKAAGFLLLKEIEFFDTLLERPTRPFAAIVGGSKVSGKLQALVHLLPRVDKILIGGGMAFTFLKALGYEVGNSLVEDDLMEEAKEIMAEAHTLGVKLYLPVDVIVADKFQADAHTRAVSIQEIPDGWMGLDIGRATVELYRQVLENVETVLWNGPMGVFEMEKFSKGSTKIAHIVADMDATTVVGGGDTADLVQRVGVDEDMSFISTGGGASLELLEGKVLPGVKPLMK